MMLLDDLPRFLERFGTNVQCRNYLIRARWPDGFRCAACGHVRCHVLRARLALECMACGKQHSYMAETIFEQIKTGLVRCFLVIWLVTSSKGGISAIELKRQMGFGSYQTAWSWRHKIRRAMVAPGREPLARLVEADETYLGAAKPGQPGRGAAGKAKVAGAVESGRGRLQLAAVPDASAASQGFLGQNIAKPASIATDDWSGYAGLPAKGYQHEPVNLARAWGDASLRLPGIHLDFGLAKRWGLLGTHHGAVRPKHLQAYLDEYVFRFNRRAATSIAHRFARLVEHAALTPPHPYRAIVHGSA